MKKIPTLFFTLALLLFWNSFGYDAKADIHSGTRQWYGIKFDTSVPNTTFNWSGVTYRYLDTYERARAEWNGHSGVSLGKTAHAWADVYYVGTTTEPGLLGRVYPVDGYLDNVSMDSNWLFVRVKIFHNTMSNYNMTPTERFSNATHEVGHTVKMKHPVSYTGNTVMRQGIQAIGAQTYDYSELARKW
jgi:hypothetical protein